VRASAQIVAKMSTFTPDHKWAPDMRECVRDESCANWAEYCARQAAGSSRTWGSTMELRVAQGLLRRRVYVYELNHDRLERVCCAFAVSYRLCSTAVLTCSDTAIYIDSCQPGPCGLGIAQGMIVAAVARLTILHQLGVLATRSSSMSQMVTMLIASRVAPQLTTVLPSLRTRSDQMGYSPEEEATAIAGGSITLLYSAVNGQHFDVILPPAYARRLLRKGNKRVTWVAAMPLSWRSK